MTTLARDPQGPARMARMARYREANAALERLAPQRLALKQALPRHIDA